MIKNKMLYFIAGMTFGFFLGCASFMIFLTGIAVFALFHRRKIIEFHEKIKTETTQAMTYCKIYLAPFIKNKASNNTEKINVLLNPELIKEIEAYCQWAHIDSMNLFIEKIACVIFDKDKDWKAFQGMTKKNNKRSIPLINITSQ